MTADQDRQCCASGHACTRAAVSELTVRPTRADLPYCACTRRAQFWPSVVGVARVRACGPHLAEVKRLGFVLAEAVLDPDVAIRIVKE